MAEPTTQTPMDVLTQAKRDAKDSKSSAAYLKYFIDSKGLLEDIVIEQTIANNQFKKITEVLTMVADNAAEISLTLTEHFRNLKKTVDSIQPVTVEQPEMTPFGPAMKRSERIFQMIKNIDYNLQEIGDYYRSLHNKKIGKTGNPTEDDQKDKGLGIFDLISGYLGFKALKNFFKKFSLAKLIPKPIKNFFTKMASKIGELFSGVVKFFGEAISKSWSKLTGIAEKYFAKFAATPIGGMVTKFFGYILKPLKWLGEIGAKIFPSVMKFFKPLAKLGSKAGLKLIPFIGEIIIAIDAIWDFFNGFGDDATALVTGKGKDQITMVDKIMSGFSSAISGFLFGIIDPKKIFDWFKPVTKVIQEIADAFYTLIPKQFKNIGKILSSVFSKDGKYSLYSFVKRGITSLWDKLKNSAGSMFEGVVNALSNGLSLAGDLKDAAIEKLSSFMSGFFDMIQNALSTLIKAALPTWLYEKLGGDKLLSGGEKTSGVQDISVPPVDTNQVQKLQDQIDDKKKTTVDDKSKAQVIPVSTGQPSASTGFDRTVTTGRNDIIRAINTGRQFNFA